MALTFPRAMPSGGVASQIFDIARVDYTAPDGAGRQGAVSAGFPGWRMSLTLDDGDVDDIDEWIAFLDSLRGSMRTFLARDLTRPYPRAYPRGLASLTRYGGGSFAAGTATSWALNSDRDLLTLNGLPVGLLIGWRDPVGFNWTTGGVARRAMARSVEAVTASATGVAVFNIEPPLPTLVPGSATATLAGVECVMRLVPNESHIGELDTLHSAGGSIVALQDLRA